MDAIDEIDNHAKVLFVDIMDEINKRAQVLADDNFPVFHRSGFLALITNAMTIGASIVVERGGPDPIPGEQIADEVWNR